MIYLTESKIRYCSSLKDSVWRRFRWRRKKHSRWLRRNEPFKRGVSIYRRTPPSIYTPGVRKIPIIAYGKMWGYDDKPILLKRKKLWIFLRETADRQWGKTTYNYWIKQKRPRSNILQMFMANIVHYFARPIVNANKIRKLKRQAFFARQDFWYQTLRGRRGRKHRIPVVRWPIFGFGWLDAIGLTNSGRKLLLDYSHQQLPELGRELLHWQHIPAMRAYFKLIRRGRLPFARYWLRAGSRLLRERRDVPGGNWEPSEELIKAKMARYARQRTEEHFYQRPWYFRQTLIQYIENYPEYKPFYSALDNFPAGGQRLVSDLGGEQFINCWDGTVLDRRCLPFPGTDLYPFDLDVTHNYGLDVINGRSWLQKRHDKAFRRAHVRLLIRFVIEELFMDGLEDDYSDQLWEDSEKMYCQDKDGEWMVDDDEGAGYDVDDEMECDLMYRHLVIGVAIRRFYKNGMKWMRLPYRNRSFIGTLQVLYVSYLVFLTFTFVLFLYLSDSFVNLAILIILALIAMFW